MDEWSKTSNRELSRENSKNDWIEASPLWRGKRSFIVRNESRINFVPNVSSNNFTTNALNACRSNNEPPLLKNRGQKERYGGRWTPKRQRADKKGNTPRLSATTESWYSPLFSTHPRISYALFDIGSFNFPLFPCPPFASRGAYYRRSFTLEIADFLEPVKGNLAPCSVTPLEIDACNARQLVGIIGTVSRTVL